MSIDYEDVRTLVKILDKERYGSVSLDTNGLRIVVEWQSERRIGTATAAREEGRVEGERSIVASAADTPPGAVYQQRERHLVSPAVGRLVWRDGAPPSAGQWVDAGAEVAWIEAGERRTAVVVPESGRIAFVRAFGSGDLVAYGQWLLVVDAV